MSYRENQDIRISVLRPDYDRGICNNVERYTWVGYLALKLQVMMCKGDNCYIARYSRAKRWAAEKKSGNMSVNLRQTPLTCSGHTRPVVFLSFSDVTPFGYFLISASKGTLKTYCKKNMDLSWLVFGYWKILGLRNINPCLLLSTVMSATKGS